MEKLDSLIIEQLANKVCAPERLHGLIAELRKRIQNNKDGEQQKINMLNKQVSKLEQSQRNLLTAIEKGLPFDEVLQKRSQEIKAERESLLVELAGIRRHDVDRILPSNIEAFSKAIRAKLTDKDFAKRYLQVLVDKIVVDGDTATMKGSYAKLVNSIAQTKKGTSKEVPFFVFIWCARHDSNVRLLPSEGSTLSS